MQNVSSMFKNQHVILSHLNQLAAGFYGKSVILEGLIDAGADVDAIDACERTSLHLAAITGNDQAVSLQLIL